jgi:hypothetical protein
MVIQLIDGPLIGVCLQADAVSPAASGIEVAARALGMPGYREVHEYHFLRGRAGRGPVAAAWSRLVRFEAEERTIRGLTGCHRQACSAYLP